jgi:hypothetical protein
MVTTIRIDPIAVHDFDAGTSTLIDQLGGLGLTIEKLIGPLLGTPL